MQDKTGKRGQRTALTGRSPLERRRSELDCSSIEEDEKGEKGEGEGK